MDPYSAAELPAANIAADWNPAAPTFSPRSRPNSIAAYKKLGYKKIVYSHWTGTKNAMSTKSKRIAVEISEQIIGLCPAARIPLTIYDISSAAKNQHRDIWPTINARMISAISPRGIRVLIGEESIVKYYTNSKRTKLLKTIHHTSYVG